jgi:hypothetical protein
MSVAVRLFALLAALVSVALAVPAAARAANWPDARLDQVAASVAGHPVDVWCEDSWADWIHAGDALAEDWTFVGGFTDPSVTTVYVSPRQCETLHALLDGEVVGTYYAASALLTLAHESVHQRGVTNEGEAECTALPLLEDIAVNHFGVPRTVSEPYQAKVVKTVVRRVNGERVAVRVTITVVRYRTVPNPWLARLTMDALRWHRSKPAEYQGNC